MTKINEIPCSRTETPHFLSGYKEALSCKPELVAYGIQAKRNLIAREKCAEERELIEKQIKRPELFRAVRA
jgi:hypothetical protein